MALFGNPISKSFFQKLICIAIVSTSLMLVDSSIVSAFQTEEVAAAEKKAREAAGEAVDEHDHDHEHKQDDAKESDEPVVDSGKRPKVKEIGKQYAQLHLLDGSIIGGEIQATAIHVNTEFGRLTVPLERVVRVIPGLNSNPGLASKIDDLVEQLGSSKKAESEQAQKELIQLGVKVRGILKEYRNDDNAQRKKGLSDVLAAFVQMIEESEEEGLVADRAIVEGDTVETSDFAIVGEIEEKKFKVKSKFGQLLVELSDIKLADRSSKQEVQEIRKSVSVQTTAFFQRKPVSTRIRVNKGDRIVIKADGVMNWTNWNNSCSPDGMASRGQWNGFNSGTLVARIGSDNSRCVKVGNKAEFVAKSSGILYLGVAMRDSYASNTGYNWTGTYKSKIVVNPSLGQ